MKRAVGIVVVGALAVVGCGGSDEKVEIGVPAKSVATTSTTFEDSLVCIQSVDSPCASPSSAAVPEERAKARVQERAAQSDLHNALTAQKVYFTDTQKYTADVEVLAAIEPSLDWGGALTVAVGGEFDSVVCLSTTSAAGTGFALADVAQGINAGTYFGKTCPEKLTAEAANAMEPSW